MTMKPVALEMAGLCVHAESTRANSCTFTILLPHAEIPVYVTSALTGTPAARRP